MELRQLRYFIKIVDLGSMSRAASVLFIAQPALSQQIASLEAELDCKLLARNPRGVSPTGAGQALYRRAVRLLRDVDEIPAVVRIATEEPAGRVVIGIPVSVARVMAMPLVRAVAQTHSHVTIAFDETPSAYLPELLLSGHLDFAIMFADDLIRGIDSTPLFEEDLFLVEAVPNGAMAERKPVHVAQLRDRRLALTAQSNSIRRLVDHACRAAGVRYELVAEMSSPDRLLELAREGLAATIMPWSGIGAACADPRLSVRQITEPRLSRVVTLGENADLGSSEAATSVRKLIPGVVQALAKEADWGAVRPPSLESN